MLKREVEDRYATAKTTSDWHNYQAAKRQLAELEAGLDPATEDARFAAMMEGPAATEQAVYLALCGVFDRLAAAIAEGTSEDALTFEMAAMAVARAAQALVITRRLAQPEAAAPTALAAD